MTNTHTHTYIHQGNSCIANGIEYCKIIRSLRRVIFSLSLVIIDPMCNNVVKFWLFKNSFLCQILKTGICVVLHESLVKMMSAMFTWVNPENYWSHYILSVPPFVPHCSNLSRYFNFFFLIDLSFYLV